MALSYCGMKVDVQGRELVNHGTALFPVACYHDDLRKAAVPWHWHEELEAVVVTEGCALVAIGGEKKEVCAGNAFFINSGVLHGAWAAGEAECRFHSLVFHPRLIGGIDSVYWQRYLRPLTEDAAFKGLLLTPEIPWHQEAMEAVERAWQSNAQEPPGYEFMVREALSRLIFLLSSHNSPASAPPSEKALRDGQRMKQMLQFIHQSFDQPLTAGDIAAAAMIGESECLRCFRGYMDATPIQYLRDYRIQVAAQMLRATQEKINRVAQKCGFQEMSYFARTFRETLGCTPSQYRRQRTEPSPSRESRPGPPT